MSWPPTLLRKRKAPLGLAKRPDDGSLLGWLDEKAGGPHDQDHPDNQSRHVRIRRDRDIFFAPKRRPVGLGRASRTILHFSAKRVLSSLCPLDQARPWRDDGPGQGGRV